MKPIHLTVVVYVWSCETYKRVGGKAKKTTGNEQTVN